MCGIAGILNLKGEGAIDEATLRSMTAILRHRGPDEAGIYLDPEIGLAHARLSIIGLSGGIQPISNEDGTLWIIYNGEAFNYLELKEDLLRKGHRFTTSTDTEVLLHLYQEYGPACLEKIIGQFAFAIWDSTKKELFLARDRVGIRPLFFTTAGGKLLFSSEIKALFLDPDVRRRLDPRSLAQVFSLWTTLSGTTVFEGVRELPPGHYMVVKGGTVSQHRYWSLPTRDPQEDWPGSLDEAVDALEELLIDAVRLRLRADVPVGAYLSGGLDSSLTTALVSKHFDNHLRSFSMSFEESRFDESSFQRELVQALGTEHSTVAIRNSDIATHLEDVVWSCETPILRTAPVPLYLLSRLVRESDFKVVLSGEGADEVFGGYNIFKEAKVRRFWGKYPDSTWRPRLLERLYPYIFKDPARSRHFVQRFYSVTKEDLSDPLFSHRIRWDNSGKNRSFFSEHLREGIGDYDPTEDVQSRLPAGFDKQCPLVQAQTLESEIFLSNYLLSSQGDRVAMANSVEGRVPFLDHRVIEFGFKLPAKWKIRGLDEKHVLKRVGARYLPSSIFNRPKQPYRAPISEALGDVGKNRHFRAGVSGNLTTRDEYFDFGKVENLVRKVETGRPLSEVQNMALIGILTTQILHERFIERFPSRPPARQPDLVVRRTGNTVVRESSG